MYRGETRYNLAGSEGSTLGAATVEASNLEGTKLEVGNRYRIEFVAKGITGGGVPWTPRFQSEVEAGLAARGVKARVVSVNPGTFEPTTGSKVLDTVEDWIPGASSVLPSRDLLGNFTFSMDIDILGKDDFNLGVLPAAYLVGIGIVAAVVALSILAPSIIVTAIRNLGKAAGEGVTAALTGLGPVGIGAIVLGVFLWMKFSKKGQAAKARYLG